MTSTRWKSWSHEEEVFLVGAILQRFFRRGSLSSTRTGSDSDCWTSIKATYDLAWRNYTALTGKQPPPIRSPNALSRHFKVMKARIFQSELQGEDTHNFRFFWDEWETNFNVDDCLLQPCATAAQPERRKRKHRSSCCSVRSLTSLSSASTAASFQDSTRGTRDDDELSSGSDESHVSFPVKTEYHVV